jgi:hypothetical protein
MPTSSLIECKALYHRALCKIGESQEYLRCNRRALDN